MKLRDFFKRPPTDFIRAGHPIAAFFLNALDAGELVILLALFLIQRPKLKPVTDDNHHPL